MVFLVKLSGNSAQSSHAPDKRCALKRLFVNNDKDLAICKREIAIVVSHSKISLSQKREPNKGTVVGSVCSSD